MPIKRKNAPKRAPDTQSDPNTTIYDHFGVKAPGDGGAEPGGREDDARVADLIGRMDRLEATLQEKDRTISTLLTQPVVSTTLRGAEGPKAPAEVDLSGLPDPVLDPEQYQKQLSQRIAKFTQDSIAFEAASRDARAGAERTQSDNVDGLWDRFTEKYEDLSDDPDLVELAATKVAKEAQRRGLDPQRYIFGSTDVFIDDVAKKVQELQEGWGGGGDADGDGDPGDPDPGEEPLRTQGIFGGVESGGKPAPGGKPEKDSMLNDIQTIQKATGFF